jgi:hypothetical protein
LGSRRSNGCICWSRIAPADLVACAVHPAVLCLPHTTELDFHRQQIEGLGPLSDEAQRGIYVHRALPPMKTRKSRPVRQQGRPKPVTLSDQRDGQLQVTCVAPRRSTRG